MKRTSERLSLHTFGIAVDMNADENPIVLKCPLGDPRRYTPTIPADVIEAWKAIGWVWGGDFAHDYDPMHFQMASGC